MDKKQTKWALFRSVTALLFCLVMLVGTTFAWMTDTLSTKGNILQTGNLDVVLEYAKAPTVTTDFEKLEWATVSNATKLFDDQTWVPGKYDAIYLRVRNIGELSLKYDLSINVYDSISGENSQGHQYKLTDYIRGKAIYLDGESKAPDFATLKSDVSDKEEADLTRPLSDPDWFATGSNALKKETLDAGESSEPVAIVIGMPSYTGLDANFKVSDDSSDPYKYRSSFKLGVNLSATQSEYEEANRQEESNSEVEESFSE